MSLTSSLNVATGSLMAADGALQIVNNNIANANTPGYTRQTAQMEEGPTSVVDGQTLGGGVNFDGYQSVRDELLQSQVEQQTQAQSSADAQSTSLTQIEQVFTTSTSDIGTEMSGLFSSISSLSTAPTNSSDRQAVLSAAQNLATSFNTASQQLTSIQGGLNTQVTQDVSQINQLTQQIAALNPQIEAENNHGQDAGTLQDQQDQLVLQLSKLANVSSTKSSNGTTLTIGNAVVVSGAKSYALSASTGTGGNAVIKDSNGTDVTSTITGGDLGGTLTMQQATIPAVLGQLDSLANEVGQAFNAAQAEGTDQNGNTGTAMFSLPSTVSGSAAGISLALTSTTQIAASSTGASGSNGNLANFTAIQTNALASGSTPGNTYANLVYQVGQLSANATTASSAAQSSLLSLNTQLSSVSGVSIDQETTSLMQYQQQYEAAARVVSTIQSLFQVTISMGTASAA
ncbi:flagellar hook-associated protein 1 FlgK [Bryocella elongata]|uniref:Flagellar hook-associated protein 1 n=1 Tax=Bryocella elongata TaxID=863522 RepID=A0A1H5TMT8_9BACT|nr:flagellar hook-associated protein FlgK [Bryocella elongata]SEF63327.1 flagellar hook-associated protein 1 FlgK [Bryocella elongata]